MTKGISVLLILCLLLPLAGCAGATEAEPVSVSTPVETDAAERVAYEAKFSRLSSRQNAPVDVILATTDAVYAVDYSEEEDEPEAEPGSFAPKLLRCPNQGEPESLHEYRPVQPPEELTSLPNFYASHRLLALVQEESGALVSVESLYMSWYAGAGKRQAQYGTYYDAQQRRIYIRKLDENGKELSVTEIDPEAGEDLLGQHFLMLPGCEPVFAQGNELRFFNSEGVVTDSLWLDGSVHTLLLTENDLLAALCEAEDGSGQIFLIEPESRTIQSWYPIPAGMQRYSLGHDGGWDLYYSDGLDVYGYSFLTQQSERRFHWLGCGIEPDTLKLLQPVDRDHFRCVLQTQQTDGSYSLELAEIRVLEPSDAGKKVLHLGSLSPDHELMHQIAAYSRTQDDFCIELTDYSRLYDLNAYGQSERLLQELLSGTPPDLLDLDGLDHRILAAAGSFTDLAPYLDGDTSLRRERLFPALLEACSVGEQLYAVAPGFSVETVLGDAAFLGKTPGWNYAQYEQILSLMQPDCETYEVFITAQDVLRTGLAMELDRLIHWETLTAAFEQECFWQLLSHADRFPDSFDWENYVWSDRDIVEYRLRQGRQLLLRTTLCGMEEQAFHKIYFDGNVGYIGYPTFDGSAGSMMDVDMGYAMGKDCSDPAAAWQFLRRFLLPESQRSYGGFPADREIFLERLAEAQTPVYLTDADGEAVPDEQGEPIEAPQGNVGTVLGVWNLFALTEAQAQQLTELLDTCVKRKSTENELIDLIMDQCAPYFNAQRTAAQTAAQVQDTVEQYLAALREKN